MNGIHGFLGCEFPAPGAVLRSMVGETRELSPEAVDHGRMHALAAIGSTATATVQRFGTLRVLLHGHPYWESNGSRETDIRVVASRIAEAFARRAEGALTGLHGDFAVALVDPDRDLALLAVDRMCVRNVVYGEHDSGFVFGPSCDALARLPGASPQIDPQQVFNYLYFHMVPGPATVYRGWRRVAPGQSVLYSSGRITVRAYWQPAFAVDAGRDFASYKRDFRASLEDGVRTAVDAQPCGAFLSGGTDSSTISGLLGTVTREPARTFSIGFDAAGYDEMEYARTAARHFGTEQHEYYVTPADVVETLPRMVAAYDQPFGNASAIPTYHCARLAREHGVERVLGGDGGDELYGGNARYARQQVLARYDALPMALRRLVVEPLAHRLPLTERIALLRKARSYVEQASQPMPERYESYNLLERLGLENVLTPDFLRAIDRQAPRRHMRDLWDATPGEELINRMLALDFRLTLADNDLPKVTRMCELAGIDVAFPMLHDPVIDVSLALPADYKLRGTTLRWFFKESLKDFLPAKIIAKEKHGFGLPVGAWLRSHPPLRALASDSLAALRQRGIVRAEFIDRLMNRHLDEHPGYYGVMVWILTALELWYRRGTRPAA